MRWRPALHFTTRAHWLNDPNGLVVVDGEYHLFFQHNPHGASWGDMSWGHAVSTDLVHWTELAVALEPYPARQHDAETLVYSGSAVADDDGTLRAFYTAHECRGPVSLNESVAMAVSRDRGRTWERHAGNPVLDAGRTDFRDPKVVRVGAMLVMAVAVPLEHTVEFYASIDGIRWTRTGTFRRPTAVPAGRPWECPDLVRVGVSGTGRARWVLLVSADHPAGGELSGMCYWVGDFDGAAFVADHPEPRWVDHGRDFYAGVTFNGLADDAAPVLVGWASNWAYASRLPAVPWRGAMSMARELSLVDVAGELHLAQRPVGALDALAGRYVADGGEISGPVDARLTVGRGAPTAGGVRFVGVDGSTVEVGVDTGRRTAWVDRRAADVFDLGPAYAGRDEAPLLGRTDARTELRVLFDDCLLEVFSADGTTVLTELAFLPGPVRIESFGEVAVQAVQLEGRGQPELAAAPAAPVDDVAAAQVRTVG